MVSKTSASSITLAWIPGDNGGSSIRGKLKESGCACWVDGQSLAVPEYLSNSVSPILLWVWAFFLQGGLLVFWA